MNYKIENGISGPIIIFNDRLKQETYFDIPNNILNIIKELEQDNRQLELKLQQKEDIINKAKEFAKGHIFQFDGDKDFEALLEILEKSDK